MSWNFRVIKKKTNDEEYYEIHEVYYNKNGEIDYRSVEPISPFGHTKAELADSLLKMTACLKKPVLEIVVKRGKEKLVPVAKVD